MPDAARRPLLAIALSIAGIALLPAGASALGPGGWDHVGDGGGPGIDSLNATASSLKTDVPGVLLVGGAFTDAGGIPDADRIATWNSNAWGAVGPGITNGSVDAIAFDGSRIFAGGTFTNAGGNANADHLAVWNGATWAPFCNDTVALAPFGGNVNALEIIGNTLYVGGDFQNGAHIAEADYLLECDLTTGNATSPFAADGDGTGSIIAMTVDSGANLYVAGAFNNLQFITLGATNSAPFDYVAKYDGASWSVLGSGGPNGGAVNGISRAITSSGANVYLGSDAVNINGNALADHVAKWDGANWSPVGSNTAADDGYFPASTFPYGMIAQGSDVYLTGSFQNANNDPLADQIAHFNGVSWGPVGSNGAGDGPWIGDGLAVDIINGQLYAAGGFTSAGGDTNARGLAFFNPQPPVVATPPPSPPATETGQRAAALKKCKKKPRAKRRSCKRKASRLPV